MNPSYRRAPRASILLSTTLLLTLSGCAGTPSAPAPVAAASSHAPAQAALAPAPGTLLDGVAAIVNDDVILKSELDAQVAETEREIVARNTPLAAADVLVTCDPRYLDWVHRQGASLTTVADCAAVAGPSRRG